MLISLESIDVVTTVVDKVSKKNQLLALPAVPVKVAAWAFFIRRGVVRRRVKIVTIESTSERVIYIACCSRYFCESVHEGYYWSMILYLFW